MEFDNGIFENVKREKVVDESILYDNIKNPSHYCKDRKFEPRKVIEDWNLDFYLGNAIKYISRAGRKDDSVEDLRKAIRYIEYEIEKIGGSK